MAINIKKSHRGLLHKKLGVPEGEKIPASKLKIHKGDSASLRKEKVFAQNFGHNKKADGGVVINGVPHMLVPVYAGSGTQVGSIEQWNAANPNQAVNRPIADYQNEFTTTPYGRSKTDNYGSQAGAGTGQPLTAADKENWNAYHSWMAKTNPNYNTDALNHGGESGQLTSASSFKQYQYDHYDKNNKLIGHIDPSVTPMTSGQMDGWLQNNRTPQQSWQSNNQDIAIDGSTTPMPGTNGFNQPIASTIPQPQGMAVTGFPTQQEAIARYKAKQPGVGGANMYLAGNPVDYSPDAFRTAAATPGHAGSAEGCENDLNSWTVDKKNYGQDQYKYGGIVKRVKKMDDGGMNVSLNSSQLIMGAISGADALVTKFMYNPQIAAAEAKTKHNLMTPITAPNQFYGTGQGMYKDGGKTKRQFVRPQAPTDGSWDYSPEYKKFYNDDSTWAAQQLQIGNTGLGNNPDVIHEVGSNSETRRMTRAEAYDAAQAAYQNSIKKRVFDPNAPVTIDYPVQGISVGTVARADGGRSGRGKGDYSYAPYAANGMKIDDQFEDNNNPNTIVEGGEHMMLPNGVTDNITGDAHSDPSGGEPRSYPEGTIIYSKKRKPDIEFSKALTGQKLTKAPSYAKLADIFDTSEDAVNMNNPDSLTSRSAKLSFQLKKAKLDQIFAHQDATDPKKIQERKMMFGGATLAGGGIKVPGNDENGSDFARYNYLKENGYFAQQGFQGPALQRYGDNVSGYQKWANEQGAGLDVDGKFGRRTYAWDTGDNRLPISGPKELPSKPSEVDLKPLAVPPFTPLTNDSGKKKGFNFKKPSGLGDFVPEAMAAINNMTDFPIYAGKMNPNYIKNPEVNIQASLNRNQSQANMQTVRDTGNASVDWARGAQANAGLYNANNEMFQNKFNAEQQGKFRADEYNAESKTKADSYNLASMDNFWDKVTRRQANKEATNQNIVESAYQKSKYAALDQKTMDIYNQMYKDFEYDPITGKFKPKKQGVVNAPTKGTTAV